MEPASEPIEIEVAVEAVEADMVLNRAICWASVVFTGGVFFLGGLWNLAGYGVFVDSLRLSRVLSLISSAVILASFGTAVWCVRRPSTRSHWASFASAAALCCASIAVLSV